VNGLTAIEAMTGGDDDRSSVVRSSPASLSSHDRSRRLPDCAPRTSLTGSKLCPGRLSRPARRRADPGHFSNRSFACENRVFWVGQSLAASAVAQDCPVGLTVNQADKRHNFPCGPVGKRSHRSSSSKRFPTIRLICDKDELEAVSGDQGVDFCVHRSDIAHICQRPPLMGRAVDDLKPCI